jgi:6-hydroxytryprostatin B O-methyltransferase
MAITSNFLCEPVPGHVSHNAVSSSFVADPKFIDWSKFMATFSMPTAAAFADATAKWGVTEAKNETAFNIAMDFYQPLFEYYAKTPELANQFASYMKAVQSSYGTSLKHLLTGFDWESLGDAIVVDVRRCTARPTHGQ